MWCLIKNGQSSVPWLSQTMHKSVLCTGWGYGVKCKTVVVVVSSLAGINYCFNMKSKESLFYSGLNLLRPIFYHLILCENKRLYLNPKLLFKCKKKKKDKFLFNFKFKSTGGKKEPLLQINCYALLNCLMLWLIRLIKHNRDAYS